MRGVTPPVDVDVDVDVDGDGDGDVDEMTQLPDVVRHAGSHRRHAHEACRSSLAIVAVAVAVSVNDHVNDWPDFLR
jgi:hypothetical protein